jgi:hypothetical protein
VFNTQLWKEILAGGLETRSLRGTEEAVVWGEGEWLLWGQELEHEVLENVTASSR